MAARSSGSMVPGSGTGSAGGEVASGQAMAPPGRGAEAPSFEATTTVWTEGLAAIAWAQASERAACVRSALARESASR